MFPLIRYLRLPSQVGWAGKPTILAKVSVEGMMIVDVSGSQKPPNWGRNRQVPDQPAAAELT
jgi:hypothetical protein